MTAAFSTPKWKGFKVGTLAVLVLLLSSTESTRVSAGLATSNPILPTASFGEFSAITYNIAGLPEIISSATTSRSPSIAEIGRLLNSYDIAHVQEDFNYHDALYENGNQHSYRTPTKGGVPFGDGLNTLSKYPIRDFRRVQWNDCTGADCFTPKGFTFSRIEVAQHVFIDFYNVHANAYNHASATAARRKNLHQLSKFISQHSADHAVIIMGDLNGRYAYSKDNIYILNELNHMKDAWVDQIAQNIFPTPSSDTPSSNILTLTETQESIDKILFKSSPALELELVNYKLEKERFSTKGSHPLSDHHPVSSRFKWKLINRNPQAPIAEIALNH